MFWGLIGVRAVNKSRLIEFFILFFKTFDNLFEGLDIKSPFKKIKFLLNICRIESVFY